MEKDETSAAADLRAFRFALDPTEDQKVCLHRHFGAARWAFNHALAQKMAAHEDWRTQVAALVESGVDEGVARRQVKVPTPSKPQIQLAWNRVKGDSRVGTDGLSPWFHEVSTYAFQSAFLDADVAWKNWQASRAGQRAGRSVGYPRFKRKGRCRDSVRIYGTIRLDGYRRLQAPRLGSLRLHSSGKRMMRYLERTGGTVQSVTLSKAGSRYYASVLVKAPENYPVKPTRAQATAGVLGVDLGVKTLAALSTGEVIDNPRHLARAQRQLTKAQRALSRTVKGSNRRGKAAGRVARLHHLVAERRATGLHATTKRLASAFLAVAIEDLHVAGMTRSSKGTVEVPGKKVRQKSGLNRSILDVSFGEFRRQLDYKTRWYGSKLVVVDRWLPSSKTCSACGAVKPKLDLSERIYRCDCGLVMDRDVNAALVIRNAAAFESGVAGDRSETENARGVGRKRPVGDHRTRPADSEARRLGYTESPRRSDPAAAPTPALVLIT